MAMKVSKAISQSVFKQRPYDLKNLYYLMTFNKFNPIYIAHFTILSVMQLKIRTIYLIKITFCHII